MTPIHYIQIGAYAIMRQQDKKHTIGVVATLCIILMLIFAGPSSAVMVNMAMDGMQNKQVGQTGFFLFNVMIGGNERIPIADFTIDGLPHIEGSPSGTLLFNLSDGTHETLATVGGYFKKGNYNITLVERHGWTGGTTNVTGNASNYGYDYPQPYLGYGYGYMFSGYGYGYGLSDPADQYTKLSYNITVDTTDATPGPYHVTGKVNTGDPEKECFSTSTKSFTLDAAPPTPTPTRRRGGGGGGGTYPPEWDGTPTPTVTGTATQTPTGTATAAPPGERVTPRPTITKPTATATETAAEGATAKTPKKGLPGFTAVFAIAGLLAIAYLVMRRRE
jgi:PGF-CTERM protein